MPHSIPVTSYFRVYSTITSGLRWCFLAIGISRFDIETEHERNGQTDRETDIIGAAHTVLCVRPTLCKAWFSRRLGGDTSRWIGSVLDGPHGAQFFTIGCSEPNKRGRWVSFYWSLWCSAMDRGRYSGDSWQGDERMLGLRSDKYGECGLTHDGWCSVPSPWHRLAPPAAEPVLVSGDAQFQDILDYNSRHLIPRYSFKSVFQAVIS